MIKIVLIKKKIGMVRNVAYNFCYRENEYNDNH